MLFNAVDGDDQGLLVGGSPRQRVGGTGRASDVETPYV